MSRHWPLVGAVALLWGVLALLLVLALPQTEFTLIYTLDDPYIHMAMAKNFAQHGVWGVTRYEFSSSSSSLLWTLLIAVIYLLVGVNEVAPFLLNVLLATLVLGAADHWLARYALPAWYRFVLLLGLLFLTPLPAMIFTGQEHLLHLLLVLLFAHDAALLLDPNSAETISARRRLLPLAALLPLARYEGLFLLLPLLLLLVVRREMRYAVVLALAALVPLALYGAISVAHGAFWLPNSVLLKGQRLDLTTLEGWLRLAGYNAARQLFTYPHMLMLTVASLALYIARQRRVGWHGYEQVLLALFLAMTLLHMQFALVGWFYRYEAYLVGLGWILLGALGWQEVDHLRRSIPRLSAAALMALALLIPLIGRGTSALLEIPAATAAIYRQPYQTGRFLQRFYQGATVALHDIGAPSYLADLRLLDLWGLGSAEVAAAHYDGTFDRATIERLAQEKGVKVAIFYEAWLTAGDWGVIPAGNEGGIPAAWVKAGQWRIPDPVLLSSDTLSFYAVSAQEEKILVESLRAFGPHLPLAVRQQGAQLEQSASERDALARRTFDNLLQRFERGEGQVRDALSPDAVRSESFTMPDGEWGNVLFLHPPASLSYPLQLPAAPLELHFRAAMSPQSWGWGGDGSTFVVAIEDASGTRTELYRQHISNAPEEQRWHEVVVPLERYAGQRVTLTLATEFGPLGNSVGDWAGWEEPRLLWREPPP